MKKLLLVAALAASVTSLYAEKVRIGTAVVAGRAAQTEAANKLGELTSNVMLPAMLVGHLAECSVEPTEFVIYLDDSAGPSAEAVTNKTAKLAKGVLARVKIEGDGIRQLLAAEAEVSAKMTDLQKRFLADFKSATCVIKLDDKGLSFEGDYKLDENSSLLSECVTGAPLGLNALDFTDKTALVAAAATENGGANFGQIRDVFDILKKNGLDFTSFVAIAGNGADVFITLDVEEAVKTIREMSKTCQNVNDEKIRDDLMGLKVSHDKIATPACKATFAIKGYEAPYTPTERLVATLPDFEKKPLAQVAVWSYYGLVKASLPKIAAHAPAEAATFVNQIMPVLPPELKGGSAVAVWEKNPSTAGYLFRISADELKSFGLASGTVMSVVMANSIAIPDFDDADTDTDEDADDDDADEES